MLREPISVPVEDDVVLDGEIWRSGSASAAPRPGIVLVHPHPKLGGDRRNNVVVSVAATLAGSGCIALSFNTRGVGSSSGRSSWGGDPEKRDVAACVRFLAKTDGVGPIYVCGYSFGAAIGAAVASEMTQVEGFVAISYPCGWLASIVLGHHRTGSI